MQNNTIHFISYVFIIRVYWPEACVAVFGMVFVTFVNALSITFIISLLNYPRYFLNTYCSYKYMYQDSNCNLFCRYNTFCIHIDMFSYLILIWVTLLNSDVQSHEILLPMIYLHILLLLHIILNILTFRSFVLLRTHIFVDKS